MWQTCFAVWPVPPPPPGSVLGVSVDQMCFFWQQNQLKAFELQPCSHSPKDLKEGKVMTLHTGIISRGVWGSLLWGLTSLVAAVSWKNMGRAGNSWFLVLSWSETCSLGLYLHCSASLSPCREWKSLYFSWCSENMNKVICLAFSSHFDLFPIPTLLPTDNSPVFATNLWLFAVSTDLT